MPSLPTRAETVYTYKWSEAVVLAFGDLENGFEIVGPFAEHAYAEEWLEKFQPKSPPIELALHMPSIQINQVPYNPDLERSPDGD